MAYLDAIRVLNAYQEVADYYRALPCQNAWFVEGGDYDYIAPAAAVYLAEFDCSYIDLSCPRRTTPLTNAIVMGEERDIVPSYEYLAGFQDSWDELEFQEDVDEQVANSTKWRHYLEGRADGQRALEVVRKEFGEIYRCSSEETKSKVMDPDIEEDDIPF